MCRHGENIYKRKDGRYEGRYVTGRSAGRTRFGYVYGASYSEVKRELLRRKSLLAAAVDAPPKSGMALNRWMELYLLGERFARIKPRSMQTYRASYARHIAPVLGRMDIGRIAAEDVYQLRDILNRKKLSQSSVAGILRLLSSAMKAAQEEGLIRRNPCGRISQPAPREEQRVLTVPEQERLRAAATAESSTAALLGLYTGMRLGEICGLQWRDIDWARGTLTVRHTAQRLRISADSTETAVILGSPKSTKSRRVIPLPAFLLEWLKVQQAASNSPFVLGTSERPAEPRTVQRQFARLIAPLELPGVHFHTLRHTFATRLLELGVDVKTVSVLLGHSSTRITLEFYAHSLIDQQRAAMEKLAQAFL